MANYKLSVTAAEADKALQTALDLSQTSGIIRADGRGGVETCVPGTDYGFPLLTGNSPPTTNTAGSIGQHYYDMGATQAPYEYICVGFNSAGFVWTVFGDTGRNFTVSGIFASLDILNQAIADGLVPQPTPGIAYGIGDAAPYTAYIWDAIAQTWVSVGELNGSSSGESLPPHGYAGQILTKMSNVDFDATWADLSADGVIGALGYNPAKVNPNLLHNWYFKGGGSQQGGGQFPVNQRGQTVYTANAYNIDRWKGNSSALTVKVEDGFISLISAGSPRIFEQKIEKPLKGGQEYTISILAKGSGVLRAQSGDSTYGVKTFSTESWDLISSTFNPASDFDIFVVRLGDGEHCDIVAAKLELGDTQTLAHQDADGNWVLNEIPDYSEQLARCQRYFRALVGPLYLPGVRSYSAPAEAVFNVTPPMRTNLAVTLAGLSNIAVAQNNTAVSATSGFSYYNSSFGLRLSAELPQKGAVACYCNDTIYLSADL